MMARSLFRPLGARNVIERPDFPSGRYKTDVPRLARRATGIRGQACPLTARRPNQRMSHRLRILLIFGALVAVVVACALSAWAWSEYVAYVKRLPLAPIPVPTPP